MSLFSMVPVLTAIALLPGCGGEGSPERSGVLAGCLSAAGGREELSALMVIHTIDSLSMAGMTGTSESWWVKEPFTGLSVTEIGPVRQEVLIMDDSVWTVDRNGHLSPGGVEERDQMELSRMTIFYDYLLDTSLVTTGPDTLIDDVPTVPVMLRDQPNVVFYFSREDWLPYMMRAVTMGIEVRSYPGGYSEIGSIATPSYSLSTIPALGQEIESWNILTEYNVPVPESIFVLTAGAGDWELEDPGTPSPLHLRGEHIYMDGEVNGVPVNVLLDSGAGATLLDSATAHRLGLSGTGRLPARGIGGTREFSFVEVNEYSAGGAGVSGQQLAVMPISDEFYPSTGERIDLILGYDFLSRFVTEIDYGRETMTLWSPDSFPTPPAGASVLPAERSMSLLSVEAVLEDSVPVRLLLDTGAGGNLHLTPAFFMEHPGFLAERPSFETEIQGVGGSETIRGFRVSSVTLGDFTVPGGLCTSFGGGDMFSGYDGILGNGILSRFVVRLNYRTESVALTPSSLFEEGLPETLTGMGLEISDGRLRVRTVIPGSPADSAGVLEGDILLRVDTTAVTSDHLGLMDTLLPGIEGERTCLLVEREGTEISVELRTGRLVP
ncbi:MAG: aspartyl protease family protein [Candidatus Fermentibacteraceae bacterium]|nr:aspartyl protease family protein [Candidatus Fermentibacteraceae bacterium]